MAENTTVLRVLFVSPHSQSISDEVLRACSLENGVLKRANDQRTNYTRPLPSAKGQRYRLSERPEEQH